jgi:hypothetical protein
VKTQLLRLDREPHVLTIVLGPAPRKIKSHHLHIVRPPVNAVCDHLCFEVNQIELLDDSDARKGHLHNLYFVAQPTKDIVLRWTTRRRL